VPGPQKPASKALVDFAHELADLSAAAILPHFRRAISVDNKARGSGFDPVTVADRNAERIMRKTIRSRFPDHGIAGEELADVAAQGRWRWLLDPIDGTRSFITGSPLWGTLIGLVEGSAPVLGLMNQPFTGERFWSDGRTTQLRRPDGKVRRMRTRSCARLAEAFLTMTHPDLFAGPGELDAVGRLKSRVRLTRYGGDCYGYCLLAAGYSDLIVEADLKPYDIVPLLPIIEAAGGVVTTWEGQPALQGGRIVAAGDARVHEQALGVLNSGGRR
jgi:myo-inositol-1(or 4)-monophosphatase